MIEFCSLRVRWSRRFLLTTGELSWAEAGLCLARKGFSEL